MRSIGRPASSAQSTGRRSAWRPRHDLRSHRVVPPCLLDRAVGTGRVTEAVDGDVEHVAGVPLDAEEREALPDGRHARRSGAHERVDDEPAGWRDQSAEVAHHRRGDTGGGCRPRPHPTPWRRTARDGAGRPEPNDRGSFRVHVQEPASLRGIGRPADQVGPGDAGTARHQHRAPPSPPKMTTTPTTRTPIRS
jgi:hypothetical protein